MQPDCVVVDAMGGDYAPAAIVRGALKAHDEGLSVALVGDPERIRSLVGDSHIPVLAAPQVVDPSLGALPALRASPRSSLRIALEAVRDGRAAAAFSCGSSGAVLLESMRTLGALPGVARPAICVAIPRVDQRPLLLLDAGASVDCRAEHLVGFAQLGAAWARAHGADRPAVGLLSNGEESRKGNDAIRAAAVRLAASPLRFVGQVEPHRALAGACDVLVADGLLGNVMLKSLEAAVDLVTSNLDQIAPPAAEALRERLGWRRRGAASLLGVRGIVLVGHGRSDAQAVVAAIRVAARAVRSDATRALRRALAEP